MVMVYCISTEHKNCVWCRVLGWDEGRQEDREVNERHLPQCAYKTIDSPFCIQRDNVPYMQKTGRWIRHLCYLKHAAVWMLQFDLKKPDTFLTDSSWYSGCRHELHPQLKYKCISVQLRNTQRKKKTAKSLIPGWMCHWECRAQRSDK